MLHSYIKRRFVFFYFIVHRVPTWIRSGFDQLLPSRAPIHFCNVASPWRLSLGTIDGLAFTFRRALACPPQRWRSPWTPNTNNERVDVSQVPPTYYRAVVSARVAIFAGLRLDRKVPSAGRAGLRASSVRTSTGTRRGTRRSRSSVHFSGFARSERSRGGLAPSESLSSESSNVRVPAENALLLYTFFFIFFSL